MENLLLKYSLAFVVFSCIATGVQAQSKASQRSMASEIAKAKALQTQRRNFVAKMNHGGTNNGNTPTLPPTANPGQGNQYAPGKLKRSQQPMPAPPPRIIRKN